MAKSVNEIYKFLDNKEQVIGTFARILTCAPTLVPIEQEVSSMDLGKIYKYRKWIGQSCKKSIEEAEKVSRDLDSDFNLAIKDEQDENKRAELSAKYIEKKAFVIESVEKVKQNADKTMQNWRRFVSGDVLKFDEVYDIFNKYVDQLKDRQQTQNSNKYVNKASIEFSKSIANLLNELQQTKSTLENVNTVIRMKEVKQFENKLNNNNVFFHVIDFKNQNLKQQFMNTVQKCNEKYKTALKAADRNERRIDIEILQDREFIASKKVVLDSLRKENSNMAKKCAEITGSINQVKNDIIVKKNAKKEIIANKKKIEAEFSNGIEAAERELKKASDGYLPEKKNKFMTIIGKIKAKFGIGKGNVGNNENESLRNAIKTISNTNQSINESIALQAQAYGKLIGKGIIGNGKSISA